MAAVRHRVGPDCRPLTTSTGVSVDTPSKISLADHIRRCDVPAGTVWPSRTSSCSPGELLGSSGLRGGVAGPDSMVVGAVFAVGDDMPGGGDACIGCCAVAPAFVVASGVAGIGSGSTVLAGNSTSAWLPAFSVCEDGDGSQPANCTAIRHSAPPSASQPTLW